MVELLDSICLVPESQASVVAEVAEDSEIVAASEEGEEATVTEMVAEVDVVATVTEVASVVDVVDTATVTVAEDGVASEADASERCN